MMNARCQTVSTHSLEENKQKKALRKLNIAAALFRFFLSKLSQLPTVITSPIATQKSLLCIPEYIHTGLVYGHRESK